MGDAVLELDMTGMAGRLLVATDIHGAFEELEAALADLGYDRDKDLVVIAGDLVDRGAQSRRCLEWIDQPGRYALRGNHEDAIEGVCDGRITKSDHIEDGGAWFHALSATEMQSYRGVLRSLPLAARIVTPAGRTVGIIHADVEGSSFGSFCMHLKRGDYRAERIALLGRNRIGEVMAGRPIPRFTDVDHVFMGHTPCPDPITIGNCSWIDTGLPHSGQATVVDADEWIRLRSA